MSNTNTYRKHLVDLPPYVPIEPFEVLSARLGRRPEDIAKLDANENPYGPAPEVLQALAGLAYPHIYPDPESRSLRQALASFTGVPVEYLLAGAGADELIDLLLRVLVEPGETVINCPPTFGMYSFDSRLNGAHLIEVRRRPDFQPDIDAIRAAVTQYHPKILFLAAPNNPDGSTLSRDTVLALLDLPVLIVLDEAYVEFINPDDLGKRSSWIREVPARSNLVVLRTFSKWAGLAGLRVGYGAFPNWLLTVLWKTKQPYNVNVAASVAAIASLKNIAYLQSMVNRIIAGRSHLAQALSEIAWLQPVPSHANFILCKVLDHDAAVLKQQLAVEHGILIRYFNAPGLQDHIRISVGRPEHTERLLTALTKF